MKDFKDQTKRSNREFNRVTNSINDDNIPESLENLNDLIQKDKTHFEVYLLLADLYDYTEQIKLSHELISKGYEEVLQLITDERGNWPYRLKWRRKKNRPIIKIIIRRAINFWQKKELSKATALFSKLLKADPIDKAGIRFYLLGIMEKMSEKEFHDRFDKRHSWDKKISEWFEENFHKHEENFKQCLEIKTNNETKRQLPRMGNCT